MSSKRNRKKKVWRGGRDKNRKKELYTKRKNAAKSRKTFHTTKEPTKWKRKLFKSDWRNPKPG